MKPTELNWQLFEDGEPCAYDKCFTIPEAVCPVCKRLNGKGSVTVIEPKRPKDEKK